MPDSNTFSLKKPIKLVVDGKDQNVTAVTLREPLAFELEQAEEAAAKASGRKDSSMNGTSFMLQIIAQVSEPRLSIVTVRQLSARDYNAMVGYLRPFLSDSENKETGAA